MTTTKTTPAVIREQIDAAWRVIDDATSEVFYRVNSATDPTATYTVRAIKVDGRHHLTCTCLAGQNGKACWHKRAATAHAEEFKAEQAALNARNEQAMKQQKLDRIRYFVELGLTHDQALQASETYTTLSDEDLVRTLKVPTRKGPKPRNDTRVFSLMR